MWPCAACMHSIRFNCTRWRRWFFEKRQYSVFTIVCLVGFCTQPHNNSNNNNNKNHVGWAWQREDGTHKHTHTQTYYTPYVKWSDDDLFRNLCPSSSFVFRRLYFALTALSISRSWIWLHWLASASAHIFYHTKKWWWLCERAQHTHTHIWRECHVKKKSRKILLSALSLLDSLFFFAFYSSSFTRKKTIILFALQFASHLAPYVCDVCMPYACAEKE